MCVLASFLDMLNHTHDTKVRWLAKVWWWLTDFILIASQTYLGHRSRLGRLLVLLLLCCRLACLLRNACSFQLKVSGSKISDIGENITFLAIPPPARQLAPVQLATWLRST